MNNDDLWVKDRVSGIERSVTRKAYMALGPKRYEKLGMASDFTTTEQQVTTTVKETPQVHRSVSAPVIRQQIAPDTEISEAVQVTEKKKPGRKPKTISSASDDAEK